MKSVLAMAAAVALASPVMAAISNPHVAGSMQGWDPGSDAMTETTPGSGVWTRTYTGVTPGSRFEFKITDGTWGTSVPGANSWIYSDAGGNLTVTYDTNTYADGWSPTTERMPEAVDPGSWTAAGDFQSEVAGGDWDNANPATQMTALGGGVYQFDAYVPAGDYHWKAVTTGSWDSISWDARSIGTADWAFHVDAGQFARMQVDALAGTARIDVLPVPEPATVGLAGVGLVGLGLRRRRRRA